MAGVWGRSVHSGPRQRARDGRVEPETTALDCTCLWLGAGEKVEASELLKGGLVFLAGEGGRSLDKTWVTVSRGVGWSGSLVLECTSRLTEPWLGDLLSWFWSRD